MEDNGAIIAKYKNNVLPLTVYPAMWAEPYADQAIYVSNAYIKYAKPYAVRKILTASMGAKE